MERYQNLKEEVDGSIPCCEISFILDKKLARGSIASCALASACQRFVSKKEKEKGKELTRKMCIFKIFDRPILDAISGRDTLRLLGIWFRPFANNVCDTKYHKRCSGIHEWLSIFD